MIAEKRVLAIGAHPDDIEYGCGGALARLDDIFGIIVTDGSSTPEEARVRRRELEQSAVLLGMDVKLLNLPKENLYALGRKLIDLLNVEIERVRPDVIFVHCEHDYHQDHRFVSRAALSAARTFQGAILLYGTPSSRAEFVPNFYVELSPEEWAQKLQALQVHQSQAVKDYLNPAVLDAAFRFWMSAYRKEWIHAEPFQLHRAVWNHRGSQND